MLTLRDGLPAHHRDRRRAGRRRRPGRRRHGPIALDAERASGYRYSPRAYLIQLRREGSGTALIDPIAFDDLSALDEAIGDAEWILHAASQDLPCLREVGLVPAALFDTELAARLLGYPRVGLATLVEVILGRSMRKEHSAVDWSKRPLPQPWLEYAALDVEVLVELRDVIAAELVESGKDGWAGEEFQHLIDHVPPPRQDPWRRTSGIHKAKGRRALAAVRELWTARDEIAAAARHHARAAGPRLGADRRPRTRCPPPRPRCSTPRASTAAAPAATPTSWLAALRPRAELCATTSCRP